MEKCQQNPDKTQNLLVRLAQGDSCLVDRLVSSKILPSVQRIRTDTRRHFLNDTKLLVIEGMYGAGKTLRARALGRQSLAPGKDYDSRTPLPPDMYYKAFLSCSPSFSRALSIAFNGEEFIPEDDEDGKKSLIVRNFDDDGLLRRSEFYPKDEGYSLAASPVCIIDETPEAVHDPKFMQFLLDLAPEDPSSAVGLRSIVLAFDMWKVRDRLLQIKGIEFYVESLFPRELIEGYAEILAQPRILTKEAVDMIFELTGGIPILVLKLFKTLLCPNSSVQSSTANLPNRVCSIASTMNKNFDPQQEITASTVRKAFEEHLMWDSYAIDDVTRSFNIILSPSEKAIVMDVLSGKGNHILKTMRPEVIERLTRIGFLRLTENVLKVNGEFIQFYLGEAC